MRSLVVGSRGSKLALIQTESVINKLRQFFPDIEVCVNRVITRGDRDHAIRLDRPDGVGIFIKEIEEALLEGRIDLAVHSLKDLPTDIPAGLALIAVTERACPADVLVAGSRLDELPPGSRIGTSSLRRAVQLKQSRSDLEVCSIRGNVDTRLRKISDGEVDGVILAAAAMLRLDWADRITEYLPVEEFLPSVGQGALAIEARTNDREVADLIAPLNDLTAWQCITAERTFLKDIGGGCYAPIAALATVNGSTLRLRGMVADPDGRQVLRTETEDNLRLASEIGGRLARRMADMGAYELINGRVSE